MQLPYAVQDVLVVTAPGSGAEVIPFLKTWVNLPMAIGFTVLYAKVMHCGLVLTLAFARDCRLVGVQADKLAVCAAGQHSVHRGVVLRLHPSIHCLLWLLCLHHVPSSGRSTSNQ